ncbi:MAG: SRPBCC family protein [Elainellaceae cyanobacterium]
MMQLHYQRSTLINAPIEVVWQFHERLDILDILTPPWQPVQIKRREGGLGVGAETEFRIWLGPVPVRWLARHTVCEPYRLFIDEQVDGPLERWVHRHQFEAEDGSTRLTDAITFVLPGQPVSAWMLEHFVKARLEDMFRYRHQITQQECDRWG